MQICNGTYTILHALAQGIEFERLFEKKTVYLSECSVEDIIITPKQFKIRRMPQNK